MSTQKHTTLGRAPTYGDEELQTLQRNTFQYFWQETNPLNGLIPDHTSSDEGPASIAGVGSFNPTFPSHGSGGSGWISRDHFALDQGPVILMIENYRSGLIWRLMRGCPDIAMGLRRAGFRGGWL